jgi:membrane carboxypeptidase/penicillin-binding protein
MDFMSAILPQLPVGSPPAPAGLVALRIDRHSGQRAAHDGPDTLFEWFSADRLPAILATQTPPPDDTSTPAQQKNLF